MTNCSFPTVIKNIIRNIFISFTARANNNVIFGTKDCTERTIINNYGITLKQIVLAFTFVKRNYRIKLHYDLDSHWQAKSGAAMLDDQLMYEMRKTNM